MGQQILYHRQLKKHCLPHPREPWFVGGMGMFLSEEYTLLLSIKFSEKVLQCLLSNIMSVSEDYILGYRDIWILTSRLTPKQSPCLSSCFTHVTSHYIKQLSISEIVFHITGFNFYFGDQCQGFYYSMDLNIYRY